MKRNANGPRRDKAGLPTKNCAACARPFVWRKKWERDWGAVIYCSDRCRKVVKSQFSPQRAR
jgi:hypothetical protein